MVKIDFDDFEQEEEKPAKKARRAADEPGADEGEKPAKKQRRKRIEEDEGAGQDAPKNPSRAKKAGKKQTPQEGEAPFTQVMDDDAIMAEKLRRIREKAMKLQMERELHAGADGAQNKKPSGKKGPEKKGANARGRKR
jgi:hypothetical protein